MEPKMEPKMEPDELLDLLQDVILPYADHFANRFNQSKKFEDRTATRSADDKMSWRCLETDLWELHLFLKEYDEQGSLVEEELDTAMHQMARSLERTLHGRRIQRVIKTEKPEAWISNKDNVTSGFAKLEAFRIYVLELSKSQQKPINNRPILKDITIDVCQLLSSQISALILLLWKQNPQSELTPTASKIPEQRSMRYSSKDFETKLSRRHRSNELRILLGRYWPCSCGESHEKMLGSCMNIMLCLQSGWTCLGRAFGEFDLLLQNSLVPLHCNVIIQAERPALLTAPKLKHPPCQARFDDMRGMKLKIVATEGTTADVTAEFCLDSVSFSEPSSYVTLQNLLEARTILRVRERRILAVILMYSFMQLLDGPWLQQYWDSADISFFKFNNDGTPSFNFRQPYLSACWMTAQHNTRPVKLHDGYHPMPDMVTLARFLLELELQDTRFSPTLVQDLRSDLLKASRLLQKLKDLDRDLWARALFIESMSACLDTETYTGHSSASPHLLLWEIYQKVVNPLEQNLLSLLGSDATFEDLERELSGTSQINAILDTEYNTEAIQSIPQFNTASDKWFKRLEDETQNLMKTVKGGAVSIAILDTGIDRSHPLLKDKIAIEDCWDFVENSDSIFDEVGHGTHTAYLLTKTAPRAKIFCGRVWKRRTEDEDTGTLVAKAIMHAVDKWNANIIVMPFAFPYRNGDIAKASYYASSKALLFAAVSNDSDFKGFPASLPHVICVYSNKTSTMPSTCREGEENNHNFSIIGEEVEGAWPLDLNKGKETKRETGTSCSTPIAAGVAALILEYATQEGKHKVLRAEELKQKIFMEGVLFNKMTGGKTTGVYNLIEPWKLLSNYDGNQPKPLSVISNNIREVIKGISPD